MSFWQNVENELQYQNISRKELAARAGFAVSGISLGINNGNVPNAELAVKIADVLRVSVRYLVTGKPDKIPESSCHAKLIHLVNDLSKLSSYDLETVSYIVNRFLANKTV